jgi:hypothetical protein
MKSVAKVSVLLKGGLGNQLFQIAAGLYSSRGETFEILSDFTMPRKTDGIADALHFEWPKQVLVNEVTSNKLERKVLALSLNRALKIKSTLGNNFSIQLVNMLTEFVLTLKFRERTNVLSGRGVGFCAISLKPRHNLLNGYFQAHQFSSHPGVFPILKEIRLKQSSLALTRLIERARTENPVIVHLRLGDYKNEGGIGLLPPAYFEMALRIMESQKTSRNLWIFTDEVESVDRYISPPSRFSVSIIGENGLNPAETLELMRHGSAYVIANSTFSWWGAFLSYQSGCTTIMPSPWFQNMPSPIGIKPQDWIEVEILKL